MARPTRLMPDQEYIYFIGLETHPSACYILYDESTLRNLNLKSKFCIFDSFRDIHGHICDFLKFVGVRAVERFKCYGRSALELAWQTAVRVGVANFFWGQSIGIDETNTFS